MLVLPTQINIFRERIQGNISVESGRKGLAGGKEMEKGNQLPEVIFPGDKKSNELSIHHYGKHTCLPPAGIIIFCILSRLGKGNMWWADARFIYKKMKLF